MEDKKKIDQRGKREKERKKCWLKEEEECERKKLMEEK